MVYFLEYELLLLHLDHEIVELYGSPSIISSSWLAAALHILNLVYFQFRVLIGALRRSYAETYTNVPIPDICERIQ